MSQTYASHAHHPVPTYFASVFTLVAIVALIGAWWFDWPTLHLGRRQPVLRGCDARVDVAHLHHAAAGSHHHARDEGSVREVLPAGQARAARRARAQADRGAALCVRRRARRAAATRERRREAAAEGRSSRRSRTGAPISSEPNPRRTAARGTTKRNRKSCSSSKRTSGRSSICRACAQTARDLAWEIKRGAAPDPEALRQTIDESERVLADLGRIEIAIAEMKAALW